jgi:hypothetical protein
MVFASFDIHPPETLTHQVSLSGVCLFAFPCDFHITIPFREHTKTRGLISADRANTSALPLTIPRLRQVVYKCDPSAGLLRHCAIYKYTLYISTHSLAWLVSGDSDFDAFSHTLTDDSFTT